MSEFCNRSALDRIRDGDSVELNAGDEERSAIAERLGLISLDRLEAHLTLNRDGETVTARGRVRAALTQSCVATGEPVPGHIDEPFEIRFVPEPTVAGHGEEIELGEEDCDIVFHDGAMIDIGAAVADTLALSIDPYQRCAVAEAALKEAGVLSEYEAGPFAALAQLKAGRDS
jgi:uncharacterized metal-binding protein YceD (DUF177 family)